MANPIIISEPHKVINSFDSPWNASALPIQYTVSNDKYPIGAVVSNYYTEIIISVNAVVIATIQQLPDSNNETKIDVRKYIQSDLSFIPSTFFGTGNDSNASCFFSITGEEKYLDSNGNSQSNPIDNGGNAYYASNSALQFGDPNGGNMYDYVLDSAKLDLAKWMTRFQRGAIIDVNNFTFSIIVNDPDFDLSVEQFDKNGALLVNEIVNIPDNGVGVYRLRSSLSELNIATKYLTVEGQKLGVPVTELLPIDVDLACLEMLEGPTNFVLSNPTISTLDASCVSDGVSFEWQLSTDENFGVIAFTITNATTTAQFTGLDKGELYFGRVRVLGSLNSGYSNTDTEATATGYEDYDILQGFRRLAINNDLCCRVQRSSDNATDFILLPDNPLTEFISLDSIMRDSQISLGDWVGVNDAIIITWSNQSLLIGDGFTSAEADAPFLVIGGVLQERNGSPCAISLDGSKKMATVNGVMPWVNTSDWTAFAVAFNDGVNSISYIAGATNTGFINGGEHLLIDNRVSEIGASNVLQYRPVVNSPVNLTNNFITPSTDIRITQAFNSGSLLEGSVWENDITGQQNISQPSPAVYDEGNVSLLGVLGKTEVAGGICELIMKAEDLTATRASIRDEINSAHNVY